MFTAIHWKRAGKSSAEEGVEQEPWPRARGELRLRFARSPNVETTFEMMLLLQRTCIVLR